MGDFTHLHVHSHYSLLDGLGKIDAMLERTKELGMNALAITDHGSMYGIVDLVKSAKNHGVKPIIGVETYIAPNSHTQKRGKMDSDPRHLTLLAMNNQGYKNLIKLVSAAHRYGFYYKPRIDYELLEQYSEGLIVLSGCLNGDIPNKITHNNPDEVKRLIEWHLNIFGPDRFYLEIQDHPTLKEQHVVNDALIDLSKKFKVGLVATADTHYIHPEDNEAQDVLVCVQTGKTVQEKDRLCMLGEDFSLKSPAEVKEAWKKVPEAIDNTVKITELCNVELQFGVNHLPRYPLPPDKTADQALRELCEVGLKTRYKVKPPEKANERLDYELEVIKKTGFSSYFLIVADFVNEAKKRRILVGPGRGSAAGSFVSYLTNITNLDPLVYNLLFERFLNPERVSMPDIDLDFADDRRDEIITYVREKYGDEHVAQIITFGTMAARAAVRDAGRALGLPYAFCDQIAKAIPPQMDFAEALTVSEELKNLYANDPQAKKLIDTAKKLEGVCRHASTHAAGVVITEQPLTEYVPLQLSSTSDGKKDTVTQYAMTDIEALGLLKVDFLGLKNLTIIQNTIRRITNRHGITIDLDTLPLDDSLAYELLQQGKTTGVFQLESSGMKRYLKELKPTEFEDIISMVALYRPGPMDSIPDFIACKNGKKKITYLHPLLAPILEKTYGIIVTQDQVLQIAREFSGFSYAEADILRKAVGKKIKSLLDEQREKFIRGAVEKKKIDVKTAEKVWDFIEPFARYGFNRAHAACYAMIAYQTAYLKAHYPAEFIAALLTSDLGDIERAAIEVDEAASMGIQTLPPAINESEHDFTVVTTADKKNAIRFGMAGIKNVGDNVVTAIVEERSHNGPFKDIADFYRRLDSKTLNRKSAESLIRAGAFDELGERQFLLHNLETLLTFNRALHKVQDMGQQNLFGSTPEALSLPTPTLAPVAAAPKEECLRWEKELLGMYISEHPLTEMRQELYAVALPLNEVSAQTKDVVHVGGVISQIKKIITKSQQPMLFVQIEDLMGKAEVLVFPKILTKTQELWVEGALVLIKGKVSDKDGERKILADTAWPLTRETLAGFKKRSVNQVITIRLASSFSRSQVESLYNMLTSQNSESGLPVELLIPNNGQLKRIKTAYRIPYTRDTATTLEKIVGSSAIKYN